MYCTRALTSVHRLYFIDLTGRRLNFFESCVETDQPTYLSLDASLPKYKKLWYKNIYNNKNQWVLTPKQLNLVNSFVARRSNANSSNFEVKTLQIIVFPCPGKISWLKQSLRLNFCDFDWFASWWTCQPVRDKYTESVGAHHRSFHFLLSVCLSETHWIKFSFEHTDTHTHRRTH